MKDLAYYAIKFLGRIKGDKHRETLINWYRKKGIEIGTGCNIGSNLITTEPYLIQIGNNVTISSYVVFITHDNSIMKVDPNCYNLFGKIIIGDNCFLGERSTILYGVELANNIIVASGSVVCNSFNEERIIIGGNPARKIGNWDDFLARNSKYAISRKDIKIKRKTNPELLIRKRVK